MTLMFERMPVDLKIFAQQSLTLNLSGVPFTAEGTDFRLEEINKAVQRFMPPIPRDKDWVNVCASYKSLSAMRVKVFEDKGAHDPAQTGERNRPSNDPEELALRALIR